MRKILLPAISMLFIILNSCEVDDLPENTRIKCLPIYFIDNDNDTTFFEYSEDRLTKIYYSEYSDYYQTLEYNENKQLSRYNEFENNTLSHFYLYEYDNSKISKSYYYYYSNNPKNNPNYIQRKAVFQKLFQYTNNVSYKSNPIFARSTQYEYDSNGFMNTLLLQNTDNEVIYKIIFENDKNGNAIKQSYINIESQNEILDIEIINEFGNINNLYKDILLVPDIDFTTFYFYKNNITKHKVSFYTEGAVSFTQEDKYYYNSFNDFDYITNMYQDLGSNLYLRISDVKYKIFEE